MNELLKKDISIKVISILFAVFLWFFVLDSSANPFDSKTLTIPVKLQDEAVLLERGLGIKNRDFPSAINIVVKGRRDRLLSLSPTDFEAVLDFEKIRDPGRKLLRIDVLTSKDGISVETKKPQDISIEVEKIVKSNFKVEVVQKGKPKESFKIINVTAAPDTIEVEGLESMVKSITSVKAEINVNGLTRVPVMRLDCHLLNKNGDEITGFGKIYNVDVTVEVAREVPVIPIIKGKLAKDFVDKGNTVSPERVLITGLPDILEKTESLETEIINVENLNKNVDIVSFLKLPDGVRLVDMPKEVKVSLFVEQLVRKDFTFGREELLLINTETDGSLIYEITAGNINVGVKGRQKDLDQLAKASFRPMLDVSRLTEGIHQIPLKVTLPGEVKLAEEPVVEIKISKKPAAPPKTETKPPLE